VLTEAKNKVTAEHLKRKAYLYVRQSTIWQVIENTESTRRQYELQNRAVVLGWPKERIEVIDTDLARSGTSAVDREGFQKLVAEVGLGRAGIVMGLEVSRLARNCADWHRLIEICAMTRTLILDEDGIYDPTEFNDRLLLGLKGTMSEAETYLIRARLRGDSRQVGSAGAIGGIRSLRYVIDFGSGGKAIFNCLRTPQSNMQANAYAAIRLFRWMLIISSILDEGAALGLRDRGGPLPDQRLFRHGAAAAE
jgi:DNA invertase Pin-like site-specific DNA recombinase